MEQSNFSNNTNTNYIYISVYIPWIQFEVPENIHNQIVDASNIEETLLLIDIDYASELKK